MYRVRGRILLLQMVLAAALTSVLLYALVPAVTRRGVPQELDLVTFMAVWYVLTLALVEPIRRRTGLRWSELMGPAPTWPVVRWSCLMAVALVGVSMATIVVVFVPLSYVAPEFVTFWLFDDMPVLIRLSGEHWQVGNLLLAVTIVLLAPMAEELMFRGLLLPAWATRMGRGGAILLTSLAFAVLHADLLGGFVFAVVLAEVFLRTGSLWLPVMIHAANNALAMVLGLTFLLVTGDTEPATLAHLKDTWWYGPIGAVIGVPLLIAMLRRMPARASGAAETALSDISVPGPVGGVRSQ